MEMEVVYRRQQLQSRIHLGLLFSKSLLFFFPHRDTIKNILNKVDLLYLITTESIK